MIHIGCDTTFLPFQVPLPLEKQTQTKQKGMKVGNYGVVEVIKPNYQKEIVTATQ